MKRLMVVLLAALAASCAWADTWTDDDGIIWTYSVGESSSSVTGVANAEYDVNIPASLGGKPVVAFGTVFYKNTKISSVVIPDGVTTIVAQAFDGCSQLQHVTVGSGVKSVGNYAFRNCALLQKIELPKATTTLGIGSFAYCEKLNTAKIPGVTSIPGAGNDYSPSGNFFSGYGAFYGCVKLRTLELGPGLTYIGCGAFYNCNELYDLVIPDNVTLIDNYAFAECHKLHNLTLGSGVAGVGTRAFYNDEQLENLVFRGTSVSYLSAGAFQNCENLRELNLPNGLTRIGEYCFQNCDSIPEVVIPDTVTVCTNGAFSYCDGIKSVKLGSGLTHIAGAGNGYSPNGNFFHGHGVFFGCTALTNVAFNGTLKSIGNGAFYGCSALPEVKIPGKVTSIGSYAFSACGLLKNVVIGDNVRLIKNHAFYGNAKLETLRLGAKVQTIEESAFQNCTALKSFSFPETVLTIGDWCFNGCRKLSDLVLPDSVGVIGIGSFSGCTGLASVTIGDGLEEISGAGDGYSPSGNFFNGYGAFYGCTGLTKVKIGASVFTIGNGAFYGCTALSSITIPSNVSSIKSYAFAANSALKTVDIKNGGVTIIENDAFNGDSLLTTINLGDRLVTIGQRAFQNCTQLTDLVLPDSLVSLGSWCFQNCKALKSINIPDKVKDLDSGVFANCSGLEHAKIGKTLATIGGAGDGYSPSGNFFNGYGAFYGCTALKSVDLGVALTTISCGAFYGCSALTYVDIPDSVTKIGDYAFGACTSLIAANIGESVAILGECAFNGDTALHYVAFSGDEAPVNVGASIFNGTKDRMKVYVEKGSVGWKALHEGGLPDNGTWQGRPITYAPPPANAGNPYDFYIYPSKATISRTDYYWSLMVTTNRYVHGMTVPSSVATIREGDPVYISYAFDEYWRGEAFNMTNRFTLSGAKSGTFEYGNGWEAHSTVSYGWKTNATPEILQGLAPGSYKLSLQLNADNRLKETDYSNNSTSITFTVVAVPKFTVKFNANGGSVSESTRTVYEGRAVGRLPVPTKSGSTFLGWYVGDTQISEATPVVANMVYTAKWQSFDIIFWKPLDKSWKDTMFVGSSSYANEMQTTFKVGDPIYFYYACYEADAQTMRTSFVNRFKLVGSNGVSKDLYHNISGIYSGTCEGVYGTKVDALQGLAAGTYTFTCTLDADKNVVESNEGNNTKSITFTIVPAGSTLYTVTFNANGGSGGTTRSVASGAAVGTLPTPTRSGYSFAGWFTSSSGGTQISAATKVTANVTYYAHWTTNGGGSGGGSGGGGSGGGSGGGTGGVYPSGSKLPITIVGSDGTTKTTTAVVGKAWGSNLPAAPTAPSGQTFGGWYTGANGTGTRVTATTIVPNNPITLYPYFVATELHWLCEVVAGVAPATAASTYNGYLYDAKGNVKGTIQVKLGKAKLDKKSGSLAAAVKANVVVGGSKVSLKAAGKAAISSVGPTTVSLVGGEACVVKIGTDGLSGSYGAYAIDGARDFFTSKSKSEVVAANAILSKWLGSVNVMWKGGSVNVAIAKKGKAKAKGTLADGKTKVSAKSVFIIGEEWCCVPVVAPKANLAFVVWLSRDGRKAAVDGLGGDVRVGVPRPLASGSAFRVSKTAALWSQISGKVLTVYLPDGMKVTPSGTKWTLPKAGKVVYKNRAVDASKLGENPSGLKLTNKAKDGSFKGSFKIYSDNGGKLKATTVNVIGVMINSKGYGTAMVKGKGSVEITIE